MCKINQRCRQGLTPCWRQSELCMAQRRMSLVIGRYCCKILCMLFSAYNPLPNPPPPLSQLSPSSHSACGMPAKPLSPLFNYPILASYPHCLEFVSCCASSSWHGNVLPSHREALRQYIIMSKQQHPPLLSTFNPVLVISCAPCL